VPALQLVRVVADAKTWSANQTAVVHVNPTASASEQIEGRSDRSKRRRCDPRSLRRSVARIPNKVAANEAYQNAKQNSDKQNARIEHDNALAGVIVGLMKDDTELFKQFSDNPEFKRWLTDTIFSATYNRPTPPIP
jgi:hypothetical protein